MPLIPALRMEACGPLERTARTTQRSPVSKKTKQKEMSDSAIVASQFLLSGTCDQSSESLTV